MSKFRSPAGQRYTAQLFHDMFKNMWSEKQIDASLCLYTLHADVPGYINFGKQYVNDMDPTGHKTAVRLLENYDHFNYMVERCKWFRDAKAIWDKEIAAKMEKEATDVLLGILRDPEGSVKVSEKINAAKAVLGKAKAVKALSEPQKANQRGRPTNEEVQGELKEQARLSKEEQDDLDRITNVINIDERKKTNG